jgi:PPP family 3-phenylpropionic acid transporter
MGLLKRQFFISYAVMGSIMPLLSVFFQEQKNFTKSEIGFVMATSGFSMMLSPVLMTLLADLRLESRRIIAGCLLASGVFILGMHFSVGIVAVGACYLLYHLSYVAVPPLQDALYFRIEAESASNANSGPVVPYNFIRVWGTVGFIIPSAILWTAALFSKDIITQIMMFIAAGFAVAAAVHSTRLPSTPPRARNARRLPSVAAARVLFGKNALWMCLPLILAYLCGPAYHVFFPLYLKDFAGYSDKAIGLIINTGVVLEIFLILNLEKLRLKFGLKKLMVIGLCSMAARFACLAAFPNPWTPILVQVFHGPEIVALFVLPMMYINRLAGEEFRNSIQGVFAMLVAGAPRVIGSSLSGTLADFSLPTLFWAASGLVTVAAVLLIVFFKPIKADRAAQ